MVFFRHLITRLADFTGYNGLCFQKVCLEHSKTSFPWFINIPFSKEIEKDTADLKPTEVQSCFKRILPYNPSESPFVV